MATVTQTKTITTTRANILPNTKPPFTLGDLKKAIPPHCFERSVIKSFSYVVYDFLLLYSFYYIASNYIHVLPKNLSYVAWPVYWVCQSLVMLAVWVIAHECGHRAFSDYSWLDNTVGMILHTSLYVPYFSWKISHKKHHANTGSMEHDEVYVPNLKSETPWFFKYLENPIGRAIKIVVLLTFGWHWYVLFNFVGGRYESFSNHFYPYSPLFSPKERKLVWISNFGILAVSYGLYSLAMVKGFNWLLMHYIVPFVMLKVWLILITFLHHTHPALPHYDSSEWEWLRGALSTVDRDYGILNTVWHNITDTHVTHHLFPSIPHYHATEASNAIKPILGQYYNFDGTPILKALWISFKECIYVVPDRSTKSEGVYWYTNYNKDL